LCFSASSAGIASVNAWLNDQADAARCVAGSVKNTRFECTPAEHVALLHKVLDSSGRRSRNAQPLCLNVEMLIKIEIALVNEDWRASSPLESREAANMVNVRVRADDGADLELVSA
jgi:hypothetical protein